MSSDFPNVVSPFIEFTLMLDSAVKESSSLNISGICRNLKLLFTIDTIILFAQFLLSSSSQVMPFIPAFSESIKIIFKKRIIPYNLDQKPAISESALAIKSATSQSSNKLKIDFEMNNFSLNIPLSADVTSSLEQFSYLFKISATAKVSMYLINHIAPNIASDMKMLAKLSQFSIQLNQNKADASSSTINNILLPTRMNIELGSHKSAEEDTNALSVNCHIEPLIFSLGLQQLLFMKVVVFEALKKVSTTKEIKEVMGNTKMKEEVKQSPNKIASQKGIQYMVNTISLQASIDPLIQFLLIDDTATTQMKFPLLKLNITNLKSVLSQCILKDETKRHFSPAKLNATVEFILEVMLYNYMVSEYEPLIEAWPLSSTIIQPGEEYGRSLTVKAARIMNINMSYSGKLFFMHFCVFEFMLLFIYAFMLLCIKILLTDLNISG